MRSALRFAAMIAQSPAKTRPTRLPQSARTPLRPTPAAAAAAERFSTVPG
jgi:hypothetical protein